MFYIKLFSPPFFFCNSISNSNIKGNSIRCGTNRSNGASKRNARIPRSFSLFSFFFKSRLFQKKEKLDTLVQTLFHRCVITNKFEITASHHTTASSLIPLDRNRDSAGSFDLITDTPTRDRSNQLLIIDADRSAKWQVTVLWIIVRGSERILDSLHAPATPSQSPPPRGINSPNGIKDKVRGQPAG